MTWAEELKSTNDHAKQEVLIATQRLPEHVAVIMDGNGRWAQQLGKARVEGHQEGMESVRDIVKASSQLGIKALTLYAFSLENWKRPPLEVRFLMRLLETYLQREVNELHENNVRICTIGKTNALPKGVQKVLQQAIERTSKNSGLVLTLALSYGGRWDLLRAMQMIALDVRRGKVSPEDLTEEAVSGYLQTAHVSDPDLVIRTSGEMRLSNFLLWESAYAELYVTETLWPEFRREQYYKALADYVRRERRFGKTSAQVMGKTTEDNTSTLDRILHVFR